MNKRTIFSLFQLVIFYMTFTQNLYANDHGLVVYQIEEFTNPAYANSNEQVNKLAIRGFSNQTVYLSFILSNEASNDLANVSISHIIPAQQTDMSAEFFLIYNWNQYPLPITPRHKGEIHQIFVPELLIKDDTIPIADCKIFDGVYQPPEWPQSLLTNIPANEKKSFLLKVKLPVVSKTTNITINADIHQNDNILTTIPVVVTVLPYKLPESNKYKSIYFFGTIDANAISFEDMDDIRRQLQDIREHGFNGITIIGDNIQNVRKLAALAQEMGVGDTIILMRQQGAKYNNLMNIVNAIDKLIPNLYVLTVDEPNKPKKMETHLRRANRLKKQNIATYAPIRLDIEKKIRDKGSLDWANYNYRQTFHNKLGGIKKLPGNIRTFYWQVYMEMPILNRYLSGFYLYHTGLDGIFPYAYRHQFVDDLPYSGDLRIMGNMSRQKRDPDRKRKYYYTTYPSESGPVSTLQWEALIAGDNDLRLCLLLEELVGSLAKQGYMHKSQKINNEFKIRLSDMAKFYPQKQLIQYRKYEQRLNSSILDLRDWIIETWTKNSNHIKS